MILQSRDISLFIALFIMIVGCSNQPEVQVPDRIKEIENLTVYPIPENPDTVQLENEQSFGDSGQVLIGLKYHVTADGSGRVFISDLRKNSIHVFQPDGRFITSLGRKGKGSGEFSSVASKLHIYNKLRHGTKLAEFHAGVGQARRESYTSSLLAI